MTYPIPDPRWEEPNLLIPGKKPTGPVAINWANDKFPMAYLSEYWHGTESGIISLTGGNDMTINGASMNPVSNALIGGMSWKITADSNYASTTLKDGATGTSEPFTLMVDFVSTEDADVDGVFSLGANLSDSTPGLLINSTTTASSNQLRFLIDNGYRVTFDAPQNTLLRMIARYDGNTVWFYVNGAELFTGVRGALTNFNTDPVFIGSGYSGQHQGFYGNVLMFRNISLSEAQVQDLNRDPYQLLIPA